MPHVTPLCGLCCLEDTTAKDTTARLAYCDVFLHITQLCGLCCLEDTTAKDTTVKDTTVKDTTAKDTTARDTTVKATTARLAYRVVFLHITQLCGLCCLEDTTAKGTTAKDTTARDTTAKDTTAKDTTARLAYCDFPSHHGCDKTVLTRSRSKEVEFNYIIIIIIIIIITIVIMVIMMMMVIIVVIIVIIIMMMMIMIIIAFKGAIRDYDNLLTAPRTDSNTYAQVARAQSCANHAQHIERLSHATCRVTCHVVRTDSSAIKFNRV